MPTLADFFPTADLLIELPAEDLGMILLQLVQQERTTNVALSNFEIAPFNVNPGGYPGHRRNLVGRASPIR